MISRKLLTQRSRKSFITLKRMIQQLLTNSCSKFEFDEELLLKHKQAMERRIVEVVEQLE